MGSDHPSVTRLSDGSINLTSLAVVALGIAAAPCTFCTFATALSYKTFFSFSAVGHAFCAARVGGVVAPNTWGFIPSSASFSLIFVIVSRFC